VRSSINPAGLAHLHYSWAPYLREIAATCLCSVFVADSEQVLPRRFLMFSCNGQLGLAPGSIRGCPLDDHKPNVPTSSRLSSGDFGEVFLRSDNPGVQAAFQLLGDGFDLHMRLNAEKFNRLSVDPSPAAGRDRQ
jgi:hypothetical protein